MSDGVGANTPRGGPAELSNAEAEARERRRYLPFAWAAFLIGAFLMGLGLSMAYSADTATYQGSPSCDGEVMRPGDSCVVFSGPGKSGSYSEILAYRQTHAASAAWGWAEVTGGVGAVLLLGGAGLAVRYQGLSRRQNLLAGGLGVVLPMSAVTVSLWWAQEDVRAASSVPEGFLGAYWTIPYTPLLTGGLLLLWILAVLGHLYPPPLETSSASSTSAATAASAAQAPKGREDPGGEPSRQTAPLTRSDALTVPAPAAERDLASAPPELTPSEREQRRAEQNRELERTMRRMRERHERNRP
ncbi:hypothetical protein [Streptomyces sp. NPDC007063]|uniref:hypothetical protein n=1 Tax=Streptomyces sp. NPDC007063 TaxID=3364772 RepID=UPI003697671F